MHKQKGLTMVSWIVVISFIGIVGVSALNIIPSYLNYFSARSILESIKDDSVVKGKTASQIKGLIIKRFSTNNLRNIKVKDALTFKNTGSNDRSSFVVELNYEDRGKIMGNLFYVTVFQHEVEITP